MSVRAELLEALCFLAQQREEEPFDRLRANGGGLSAPASDESALG